MSTTKRKENKRREKSLFYEAEKCLKLFRLWRSDSEGFLTSVILFIGRYLCVHLCYVNSCLWGINSSYVWFKDGNLNESVAYNSMFVQFTNFGFKTCFLIYNEKLVRNYIRILNAHPFIDKKSEKVQRLIGIIVSVFRTALIGYETTAVFYLFIPILMDVYQLPVRTTITYGIDVTHSPNYELFSVLQILGAAGGIVFGIVYDLVYCEILMSSYLMVNALKEKLKTDFNLTDGSSATFVKNEKLLRNFIETFTEMLRLIDDINESFVTANIVNFLQNYVGLAETLFNVSLLKFGTPRHLGMTAAFFSIFVQLAVYCNLGQRLTDEIDDVWYTLYEFDWYNQTPKFKKDLIMCLTRGQKTTIVSAGKILTLSRETLQRILTSSMTLYTFLVNTQKKNV